MALSVEDLAGRIDGDTCLGKLIERQAARLGDKPLLKWRGDAISYAEVDRRAGRVAAAFADRGIGRGDRVAMMMANSPEWVSVWLGLAKLGAIAVTLNSAYKGDGLAYLIADSNPAALVLDADFLPRFEGLTDRTALPPMFVRGGTRDPVGGTQSIEALFSGAQTSTAIDLDASAPCSILYTSGTTGPPKGCLLPHGQYLASAHVLADNCDYGEDTTLYTCLPLFHVNAQTYSLVVALVAGATLALDDSFTASGFWDRLIEVEATAFNIIGSMAVSLYNRAPHPAERRHAATVAFGAPMPLDIWEDWEARFGVRVVYTYGMTENGLPAIFPLAETPALPRLRGSAGRASAMAEIAVVDDRGHPVPPGARGEIVTRPRLPATMMRDYVGRPEATIDAFRDCWFHTGDIGILDAEGFLFYVDRKKDALRRKGEMVSSWEVENVVSRFPGVRECAVVGVPSVMGEEDVLVTIVAESGRFDPAALIAFCQRETAAHQVPRYVRFVDALPRTRTERVEKYRLRETGVTDDCWDADAGRAR